MVNSQWRDVRTSRAVLGGGFFLVAVAFALASARPQSSATAAPEHPTGTLRTQAAPDLFSQSAVRDFYVTFKSANWSSELDKMDETGFVEADLKVDGVTYTGVGLRYKGNSSSRIGGKKKPFGLGMDAFHAGQKLYGYDTLNLNNSFLDPSYVREVLTYDALRPFLPTPRASYAKLHLNGEYWGLYVLIQQVERSFTGDWFADKDGLLVKADAPAATGGQGARPPFAAVHAPSIVDGAVGRQQQPGPRPGGGGFNSALTWLGEDVARYKSSYEVKTSGAGDAGYAALQELTRKLDAPTTAGGLSDAAFAAQISEVLDVDGALWYIAAHNLFTNFDSYYSGHNYFIYRSRTDPRWTMLSWDMNETFGLFRVNGVDSASTQGLARTDPFLAATDAARPVTRRLFAVPAFRADYAAHYRTLARLALEPTDIETKGRALQQVIRSAAESDPNKLYDFALFEKSFLEDIQVTGSTGGAPARGFTPGVLSLAKARQAWVTARADMAAPDLAPATPSLDPAEPTAVDAVAVMVAFSGTDAETIQSAQLVYRVSGASPRTVGMTRSNGAAWQATVPVQRAGDEVTYYVRLVLADGRSDFWPAANWTKPWSYRVKAPNLPRLPNAEVVINELMADNSKTIADEAGEYDDWLEIVNRGRAPVSLDGLFLGPNPDKPWDLALPDVTLAPGEHYLVWCDGDTAAGSNHAPFKLSKGGDRVVLSNRMNRLDDVEFGPQSTDLSFARLADGGESWGACASPTPGRANRCGGAAGGGGTGGEGARIFLPAVRR